MVVCYFTREKAKPKNEGVVVEISKVPLTEEEQIYTQVNEQVTAKEVTNLRTAATTKSNIVYALQNGEVATRIAVGKNGWSKLNYQGKIVYAISNYLTKELSIKAEESAKKDIVADNVFTAKYDQVTAKQEVNLRSMPTTDSEIVGKLVIGTFLERTAVSNKGWSRLNYQGQIVYAVTSYLSNEVVQQQITPTPSDGYVVVDEQVTAKSETNLRSAPSTTSSEIVYLLKSGEYVRRIGIHSNGWSKLEYNGEIVYAITSYLIKE